jgi:RHS repeat-associated protein
MEQLQFGNNLYEQTCYNNRLQPTQKRLGTAVQSNCTNPGSDLLHLSFGYGTAAANNGNPVSQTIVASGYTLTQNYGYDPVNRLKIAVEGAAVPGSMTCPVTTSWCQEYNFDHFGNRWVASNLPLHSATPTSAAAFSATTNRLTAATYDNAGNMTAHPFITPSGSIAYNANNLATQFTATAITAGYGYDAQGRRVRQTHNGVTIIYVYDATGRLAVEYSSQAPSQTNGIYYRTVDHLDSTRVMTDSTGKVKLRRDFFPFGEEIPASASYGNRHLITDNGVATYNAWSGLPQQFTGQQRDGTGLDNFTARNYFGPPARFLSVDPANAGASPANPQGWNAFAYVLNNPLQFVDSTGRYPCFSTFKQVGDVMTITSYDCQDVPPVIPGYPSGDRGGYESYYGEYDPQPEPLWDMILTPVQKVSSLLQGWWAQKGTALAPKDTELRSVFIILTLPYPKAPFVGGDVTVLYSFATNQFCMAQGAAAGLPAEGGGIGTSVFDSEMFKPIEDQDFNNIFGGFGTNYNGPILGQGTAFMSSSTGFLGGPVVGVGGPTYGGGVGGCTPPGSGFSKIFDF